ncbi:MAG: histidine--tRNA ligase [Candidatus Omnitrophota bacterium]
MKAQLKALRGTKDLLPEEAAVWTDLEEKAKRVFSFFNFTQIRTPIIEDSALFVRSLGEGTDIVEKQMYTFLDRGQRSITLRPEATASVVRAYIENNMQNQGGLLKLFYIGPMFRAERPQAGRMRQFHQIGVEAIGSYSPHLDAEVIILLSEVLDSFNIVDYTIKLNSLGCEKDKIAFADEIRKLLKDKINNFCEDCGLRYEKNILRILDCKNENCKEITKKIFDGSRKYLCPECEVHFDTVKRTLSQANVNYRFDPYLVRGLDYYTKTTFEVVHKNLGAQDAVAAGGRYDNLVEELGGPQKGACGFAIGMERAITAVENLPHIEDGPGIFMAAIGNDAYGLAFELVTRLRENGISADLDYDERSLKSQMRMADKLGVKLVGIIGEDEIKNNAVTIRNMSTKEQLTIPLRDFTREIERMLIK